MMQRTRNRPDNLVMQVISLNCEGAGSIAEECCLDWAKIGGGP